MMNLKQAYIKLKQRYPTIKVESELEEEHLVWYFYGMPFEKDRGKVRRKKEGYIFKFPSELPYESLLLEVIEKQFFNDGKGN